MGRGGGLNLAVNRNRGRKLESRVLSVKETIIELTANSGTEVSHRFNSVPTVASYPWSCTMSLISDL